ncbi:hypothetical protein GQ54DRAFT_162173 [Martensiomyces pterosporus]|nr:hypothetical protein GQ54DRAFT_162173 [Martensiomyces pterosporus]
MALTTDDPSLISSYELVTRSLEDAVKYDNLSDAEKSRARKKHVRRVRRTSRWQQCLTSIRNVDMFWALTILSIGTFVLIALSLLYYRHSYQLFLHRFSHEELMHRRHHLGFDHIYILERPIHESAKSHAQRWEAAKKDLDIEYEMWPVSIPSALDPKQVMLHQRECWRPHLAIYRDMVLKGHMDALIVEDHVMAGPSPQLRLYHALMQIPADWDMLQLGPAANGTDSGHHDDMPIHRSTLKYRRVDDGACNNLAYAISRAGVKKVLKIVDSTHAHADFEHKMLDALDKVKFLIFRVSPSIFSWQSAEREI